MQSKLAKISLVLLIVATFFRLLSVYIHVATGQSSIQDTLNGFLGGLIISLLILLPILVIYGRRLGRYKQARQEMSQTTETYVCILAYGASYRLISADKNGLTIWKLKKTTPIAWIQLPWSGIIVEKARVNLTAVRSFDGINLTNISGKPGLSLVLYGEKASMLGNKPVAGPELDEIIARWQERNQKPGGAV